MSKVVEKAYELITPIVERLGYEIVEINFRKVYNQNNLTVFIHKQGGVSLDDCELVSRALDDNKEIEEIADGETYILNISSPGLDRPIVSDKDFDRNMNTEIEIIFFQPIGKKKKAIGILTAYDADNITISHSGKSNLYPRNNKDLVRPYINFK